MSLLATLAAVAALQAATPQATLPGGRECTAEERAALLAPGTHEDAPVRLTCRARLGPGERVTRRILIEGAEGSGAGLDCDGAEVGRPGQPVTTRAPTIAVWSREDAAQASGWSRPSGVAFSDCVIHGAVRVWGVGAGQRLTPIRESSRMPGHTERLQAAAPVDVRITRSVLVGSGSIPLYVGPGVTGVAVTDSRFEGRSVSTAVYLDAESGFNVLRGNRFEVRTGREVIAVDGSAANRIEDNVIRLNKGRLFNRGGVFLYRNCGEDAIVRHQTPSNNRIAGNLFLASWLGPARGVVVGSREGNRRYCGDDAGYPFGSSIDDGDHATGNVVEANRVRRGF